jgi:phosphatidylglycerophosphate synthase
MERREVKTRNMEWARWFAKRINRLGASPNGISMLGVICAAISGILFYRGGADKNTSYIFVGAVFIQLRLLCNMLDGMIAIEHNKKSVYGELFNDIPDRFEDVFIIVGIGYVFPDFSWLGWVTALWAVLTAYVRHLGKALGCPAYFFGPQAKQHRMFLLTAGAFTQCYVGFSMPIVPWTMMLVAIGTAYTFFRRLGSIARDLEKQKVG